jgi:hypothetical protein
MAGKILLLRFSEMRQTYAVQFAVIQMHCEQI